MVRAWTEIAEDEVWEGWGGGLRWVGGPGSRWAQQRAAGVKLTDAGIICGAYFPL